MNSNKKFKTFLAGYCHILPDMIVLTETKKLDNPPDNGYPYVTTFFKIVAPLIAVFQIYIGIEDFLEGEKVRGIFYFLYSLGILFCFVHYFWHSTDRIILRDSITKIVFKERIKYWRHDMMIISFKDKRGNNRKRVVGLRALDDLDEAKRILGEEGLL